jgi:hypothetical protein
MEAWLGLAAVVGVLVVVGVLSLRVPKFTLSVAAVVLTAALAVALVLQATVAERAGGWAAIVLGAATLLALGAAKVAGGEDDADA